MTNARFWSKLACAAALVAALLPATAFAANEVRETAVDSTDVFAVTQMVDQAAAGANADGNAADSGSNAAAAAVTAANSDAVADTARTAAEGESADQASSDTITTATAKAAATVQSTKAVKKAAKAAKAAEDAKDPTKNKVLSYDRKLIKKIGTQESTGHTICCPSFSCAYADAVMDGTVHDHEYYTCSCCTWTDWGGGNSSFRCVGSSEELLREAYDQILAGRPTVIHVTASTGEHWIALIGYRNVEDPDHLTLSNFIALDPWDGKQIKASDRYALYGDGCEHVSSRKVKKSKLQATEV